LENGKSTAHIGKTLSVLNGLGLNMHVARRGRQATGSPNMTSQAVSTASAQLKKYLDGLALYDTNKLLASDTATQQLAKKFYMNSSTQQLASEISKAQQAAGQALKSAASQIEELQKNMKYTQSLPSISDD